MFGVDPCSGGPRVFRGSGHLCDPQVALGTGVRGHLVSRSFFLHTEYYRLRKQQYRDVSNPWRLRNIPVTTANHLLTQPATCYEYGYNRNQLDERVPPPGCNTTYCRWLCFVSCSSADVPVSVLMCFVFAATAAAVFLFCHVCLLRTLIFSIFKPSM